MLQDVTNVLRQPSTPQKARSPHSAGYTDMQVLAQPLLSLLRASGHRGYATRGWGLVHRCNPSKRTESSPSCSSPSVRLPSEEDPEPDAESPRCPGRALSPRHKGVCRMV